MGVNEAERLKQNGIPTKKASVTKVPIDGLFVVTAGDTAHPRWSMPVEQSLIDHIVKHGIPVENQRIIVRESGVCEGGPIATVNADKLTVDLVWSEKHANDQTVMLEMINGARRLKHGLIAQAILRATAPRQAPLTWNKDDPSDLGSLYVEVELFTGEIPIQLLPAVLDAPRDQQEARAQAFVEAGVKSKAGATRMLNEEKVRRKLDRGDLPRKLTRKQSACVVLAGTEVAKTNARVKAFVIGLSLAAGLPCDVPDELKPFVEKALKKGEKK